MQKDSDIYQEESALVSVIVATYNSEVTLRQCLDSLRAQTYSRFEVLMIDDGSTDTSWEIMLEYSSQDLRFQCFKQRNAGPGAARNKGLDHACGEYVLCIDADDWVEPTLLEKALTKAREFDADVVVWDAWFHNMRTAEQCLSCRVRIDLCEPAGTNWQKQTSTIFQAFQNWAWNKLVRRSVIEREHIRFHEKLRRTEDLIFTAKALIAARVIVGIPEALVHYRMAQSGSAMSTTDETPFDCYKAFKDLKAWLEAEGIYEALEQSYGSWAYESVVYNLKTVRNVQTFEQLYDFMKHEGLMELGITSELAEHAFSPDLVYDYQQFTQGSYESYLFFLLNKALQGCEDEGVRAGQRWFESELLRDENEDLKAENRSLLSQLKDYIECDGDANLED